MLFGLNAVQHIAQATTLAFGQALGDAIGLGVRNQHHETPRQRHFLGEPGTLFADWIFCYLTENQLSALQHLFDAWLGALLDDIFFVELHVAAIQHSIFRGANVDESRFHAG